MMKPVVLVTRRFDEEALSKLRGNCQVFYHDEDRPLSRERLLEEVREVQGLICTVSERIDGEILGRAGRLQVISTVSVGFDHIDLQEATRCGVMVTYTPDVLTETTADLTWALLLATARRVVEGDRKVRERGSLDGTIMEFLGCDVHGRTLGIVGMGRIGRAVARRAMGFSMKVLYFSRRRLSLEEERSMGLQWTDWIPLLESSDFLTLHVPLTPETHHLISGPELARMKGEAILINTSRGPVVDEEALCQALLRGQISGAGLDVYEREPEVHEGLKRLPQVVLTPHIGSATRRTRRRMTQRAVENCLQALAGQRPVDLLNPEVLERDREAPLR
jgi:glyoxylate reductase